MESDKGEFMNHSCSPTVCALMRRTRGRRLRAPPPPLPYIPPPSPPPRSTAPGLVNDDLWVASRDIEIGEEVCYDYAMSETPDSTHMPFDCRCGTASCRGKITGLDCLLPALREKYGVSFSTLVQKLQQAEKAKETA